LEALQIAPNVFAVKRNPAGSGFKQARQHLDGGALSRTVGTKIAENLPRANDETYVVHRGWSHEGLGEVVGFQHETWTPGEGVKFRLLLDKGRQTGERGSFGAYLLSIRTKRTASSVDQFNISESTQSGLLLGRQLTGIGYVLEFADFEDWFSGRVHFRGTRQSYFVVGGMFFQVGRPGYCRVYTRGFIGQHVGARSVFIQTASHRGAGGHTVALTLILIRLSEHAYGKA
jgi:hypothetical protein